MLLLAVFTGRLVDDVRINYCNNYCAISDNILRPRMVTPTDVVSPHRVSITIFNFSAFSESVQVCTLTHGKRGFNCIARMAQEKKIDELKSLIYSLISVVKALIGPDTLTEERFVSDRLRKLISDGESKDGDCLISSQQELQHLECNQ